MVEVRKPKGCIFVVDDQKALVEAIEAQFHYCGFEVIKATDAKRALELSDQIKPDLIITDIRMPKLDGIAFVKKFKESQPGVKVILMTGYYPDYEEKIKEVRDSGLVEEVIQKPFYARDLEDLVYRVLEPHKEVKEGERGPALKTTKLLIVDDEEEVTDFLRDYFRNQHYPVTTASSAEEALSIAENFLPDVILTDIKMPGKDGIFLIKEVRKQNPHTQFIVMTGQSHHQVLQQLKQETGIEEFLTKPLGLDELERLVARLTSMMAGREATDSKLLEDRKR